MRDDGEPDEVSENSEDRRYAEQGEADDGHETAVPDTEKDVIGFRLISAEQHNSIHYHRSVTYFVSWQVVPCPGPVSSIFLLMIISTLIKLDPELGTSQLQGGLHK